MRRTTAETHGTSRSWYVAGGLVSWALVFVGLGLPGPATGQTIEGTLLDLDTEEPISLGLVLMYTEAGDSVEMTVTDELGRFRLASPEPGSFLLRASALGYEETPAGVFELGEDAVMTVEYRLEPRPLALDALVVNLEGPVLEHRLVRRGFVRRLQRGLGVFITPHDIEESSATSTEQLLTGISNVRVGPIQVARGGGTDGIIYERPEIGETVQIRAPGGGWCTPTLYVDGIRAFYDTQATGATSAATLSTVAPLTTVEAVEVYRRPAEIPVEYSNNPTRATQCGVLVVWTKTGPAPGQRPLTGLRGGRADVGVGLPIPEELGEPPKAGETVRVQLDGATAEPLGLESIWDGTYQMVREGNLLARHEPLGHMVAVPLAEVEALQVRRTRSSRHAVLRGLVAGAAFAAGVWLGLEFLCDWTCREGSIDPTVPSAVGGAIIGFQVYRQGPGEEWVAASLPGPARDSEPSVSLAISLPHD